MSQPTKSNSFIELQDLSYRYASRLVLSKVDLRLNENGFYVIVGPNGGGKTTLLRLIMGLYNPTVGSVVIEKKPAKMARGRVGYVPQKLAFDTSFPLSVEEFVLSGAISKLRWYGMWPKKIRQKAIKLLTEVGMIAFSKEQISTLSGGQFQRASLARALIDEPDILLLDEPFSGLDPDTTRYLFSALREMKGSKTIILVTHTLSKILELADEIYSVGGSITKMDIDHVCEHFSYGIYHDEKGEC